MSWWVHYYYRDESDECKSGFTTIIGDECKSGFTTIIGDECKSGFTTIE